MPGRHPARQRRRRRREGQGSLGSGLTVSQLVKTAWASASTYRKSDNRGGANGARVSAGPAEGLGGQRAGRAGHGAGQARGYPRCFGEQALAGRPDRARRRRPPSRRPIKDAGFASRCRSPAAAATRPQDQTDVESFAVMEPEADAFRNYLKKKLAVKVEELMLDRAQLLGLSVPEMTALIGGLRVLGANHDQTRPWCPDQAPAC
jgi:catalase-peroxidase